MGCYGDGWGGMGLAGLRSGGARVAWVVRCGMRWTGWDGGRVQRGGIGWGEVRLGGWRRSGWAESNRSDEATGLHRLVGRW